MSSTPARFVYSTMRPVITFGLAVCYALSSQRSGRSVFFEIQKIADRLIIWLVDRDPEKKDNVMPVGTKNFFSVTFLVPLSRMNFMMWLRCGAARRLLWESRGRELGRKVGMEVAIERLPWNSDCRWLLWRFCCEKLAMKTWLRRKVVW